MDPRQVFTNDALKQEFLDRFDEIKDAKAVKEAQAGSGLESLEGGVRVEDAAAAADEMVEGTYEVGAQPGLEAIVERFARPVYLVQQSGFTVPPDDFPDSEVIREQLEGARARLESMIPSAGRIDVRNHRLDWLGTAWMVGDGIAVTNRHVAREFARAENGGFVFRQEFGSPPVKASIDWRHEYQQGEESVFRVEEVLWIEPEGSVDVALLRIGVQDEDGNDRPRVIDLMTRRKWTPPRRNWRLAGTERTMPVPVCGWR